MLLWQLAAENGLCHGGGVLEQIRSRENGLVREYVRLRDDRRQRYAARRFVLEGVRLCGDALRSGVPIDRAFFTARALAHQAGLAAELTASGAAVWEIDDPVARKMGDTRTPQGVFAIAAMLDKNLEPDTIDRNGVYVALENLQDPGNLGTVLRTAEALGLGGVLLSTGCADVYGPKTVRASMGAVFRLPVWPTEDLPDVLRQLSGRGLLTLASVPDASAGSILAVAPRGGAVVAVGNEGAGLTAECAAACRERVTIPMRGRAESLNAAGAAAILMWELMKNR